MVKIVVLREYRCDDNKNLPLTFSFESVIEGEVFGVKAEEEGTGKISHPKEYHLDGVDP